MGCVYSRIQLQKSQVLILVHVAENADPSTVIYAATATDADSGDTITWSLRWFR